MHVLPILDRTVLLAANVDGDKADPVVLAAAYFLDDFARILWCVKGTTVSGGESDSS